MATTTDEENHHEDWYLDIGCSNHMTSHREWLINFNNSSKTKIRFADNRIIPAEGVGDVLIKGKKGHQACCEFVKNHTNTKLDVWSKLI
ncbi:retrovirus-related pol polyprotein from transposon TNT 1-94, partial [Trifolium medium]|nr:retrovirus-related pol polyprotein from transposon TNT 1-94 [Trifolium medium]